MVNLFYLDNSPKKCARYYCDKHVNKIMIEIAQILSQIHHKIGKKKPPYQKCRAIHSNLAPYQWAMESKRNYKYCAELAYYLLKEYKYRYEKNEHKCEKPILWLLENIPKEIKKERKTKFKLTENVAIGKFYKNPVTASKYIYVDFKCKNDKWTKRGKPSWFDKYENLSNKKLIRKIMNNVRIKLPKFSKKHKLN